MAEDNERINQLLAKLDLLSKKQESFSKEINELRDEIYFLKSKSAEEIPHETKEVFSGHLITESPSEPKKEIIQGEVQSEPAKNYSLPPEIPGSAAGGRPTGALPESPASRSFDRTSPAAC